MTNKFKNYTAEEFMKLCFADDSVNPQGGKFWDNFKKINIEDWKANNRKIYYDKKFYDKEALPDPDGCSKRLYDVHEYLWNLQCQKFDIPQVNRINDCELKIDKTENRLSSDSIMSIYWHRNCSDLLKIMDNSSELNTKTEKLRERLEKIGVTEKENHSLNGEEFTLYKKFICLYLQYANTIGGFIVFSKHKLQTINTRRAGEKMQDRFDLGLECIRRYYIDESEEKKLSKNDYNYNPLFSGLNKDYIKEDEEFFKLFGEGIKGFKNYAKFFCLDESYGDKHNWVNEKGQVLNLFDNQPLDAWDFNKNDVLPTANNWWTFYHNIMKRLDARNEQIKKLLEEK